MNVETCTQYIDKAVLFLVCYEMRLMDRLHVESQMYLVIFTYTEIVVVVIVIAGLR